MERKQGTYLKQIVRMALISVLLIFVNSQPCQAQKEVPSKPPSVFQQLFPTPTGQNGYEELVRAGELAHGNTQLQTAAQTGASLRSRRNVLADPSLALALKLLRVGLAKPILAMRKSLNEDTVFPELPMLRELGLLLKVEQYVLLADGHNADAIDSVRDALKFAQVIQSNFVLSGLIGISIDTVEMSSIARHVEVFSIPDCDHLLTLLEAWLTLPSPLIHILQGERDFDTDILKNKREDSEGLTKLLGNLLASAQNPPVTNTAEIARLTKLRQWVEANPQTLAPVVEQAVVIVKGTYEQAIHTLSQPTWTWTDPPMPDETTLAGQLALTMIIPLGSIMDKYLMDRTRIQLLAVHTAIRRYRWENDRLPGSLEELKIGDRALDPFTGKPLIYVRTGDTYELSSAGNKDRGSGDTPPSGSRLPIFLIPKSKP